MKRDASFIFCDFNISYSCGATVFSSDLTNSNNSDNNDNIELLPSGLRFLNKGFTVDTSEDLKLDQLLGVDSTRLTKNELDWLKWLGSLDNVKSRAILGSLPFLYISENEEQSAFFLHTVFFSSGILIKSSKVIKRKG